MIICCMAFVSVVIRVLLLLLTSPYYMNCIIFTVPYLWQHKVKITVIIYFHELVVRCQDRWGHGPTGQWWISCSVTGRFRLYLPSFLRYVLSKLLFFFEIHLKVITFTSCVYIQPKRYILHLNVVPHKLRWNQCGCKVFFFFFTSKGNVCLYPFANSTFYMMLYHHFQRKFVFGVCNVHQRKLFILNSNMFQEWANKPCNVQNQIWFNCSYFWSCHWLSRY